MTEITRLTSPQNEYLQNVAELCGRNVDINFGHFAKINNQNDPNFCQNDIIIEYTKNVVGYILSKERRQSEIDISQFINGLECISYQLRNSEKELITDLQRSILRTYPRLTARGAIFMQMPAFIKYLPPNDQFLKELVKILENEDSHLDYKPQYESRIVSHEQWTRFLLSLNTT